MVDTLMEDYNTESYPVVKNNLSYGGPAMYSKNKKDPLV